MQEQASQKRSAVAYTTYRVGKKVYWRTASAVMACHIYNASAPKSDIYWFDATWQPKWWGGKVLTIRENFIGEEAGNGLRRVEVTFKGEGAA